MQISVLCTDPGLKSGIDVRECTPEWADYAAVQALCGNLSGNGLTRTLSENTRPESPQLARPLWADPGLKSGIHVRELISPILPGLELATF